MTLLSIFLDNVVISIEFSLLKSHKQILPSPVPIASLNEYKNMNDVEFYTNYYKMMLSKYFTYQK